PFLVRDLHLLRENPHTLGLLPESFTACHLRRVLSAPPLPSTRPSPSVTGFAAVLVVLFLFSVRFCSSHPSSSLLRASTTEAPSPARAQAAQHRP
ncbi:Retrotransposon-derived protein PEG10, partial [Sesbania bispinosa]